MAYVSNFLELLGDRVLAIDEPSIIITCQYLVLQRWRISQGSSRCEISHRYEASHRHSEMQGMGDSNGEKLTSGHILCYGLRCSTFLQHLLLWSTEASSYRKSSSWLFCKKWILHRLVPSWNFWNRYQYGQWGWSLLTWMTGSPRKLLTRVRPEGVEWIYVVLFRWNSVSSYIWCFFKPYHTHKMALTLDLDLQIILKCHKSANVLIVFGLIEIDSKIIKFQQFIKFTTLDGNDDYSLYWTQINLNLNFWFFRLCQHSAWLTWKQRWYNIVLSAGLSQQTREIESLLIKCWSNVCDAGPALNQHWFNVFSGLCW